MKFIFFYANWCKSSDKMLSTVYKIQKRFNHSRFEFSLVDVDTEKGAELSCVRSVKNVPTVLFLDKNGKEVERFKGVTEYETLVETIKKYIR